MKIHRPVAEQVISALCSIFGANPEGRRYYADKVIERLFKNNRKLGARDRRFVAEATYGIVRWWRLYLAAIDSAIDTSNIEASPSVATLWQVFGVWMIENSIILPEWRELQGLNPSAIQLKIKSVSENPAIAESVPDWIYQRGLTELGKERWHQCLKHLNEQAPVIIRTNRLKTTPKELQSELLREDIDTQLVAGLDDALMLTERRNVFTTESFKVGHFEVQDGASQMVAPLLDISPGHRVIDACAGAGGKTLHLAALMRNKGKIIALDIHQSKLEELRKRSSRAGVDVIETRLIESSKTFKRMEGTADRLLLDVPCSGLGVLRRNPDSKWKLTTEDVNRLTALQAEILDQYSVVVKPGGRMVYATCSILTSENMKQVEAFLAKPENTNKWRLVESHQYWPGDGPAPGFDGFFAAALQRI
jgi:16S rRNA (cytosine967-C5)-methyltransferase